MSRFALLLGPLLSPPLHADAQFTAPQPTAPPPECSCSNIPRVHFTQGLTGKAQAHLGVRHSKMRIAP